MSDDIVARLRLWSDNAKEQDATEIVVGLCQAADEIERLREALRLEQEESAACAIDRKETQRERDQARREVCAFVSGRYSKDVVTLDRSAALEEAKQRGWDCFKEATDGNA